MRLGQGYHLIIAPNVALQNSYFISSISAAANLQTWQSQGKNAASLTRLDLGA
jgi:hypothetical protein